MASNNLVLKMSVVSKFKVSPVMRKRCSYPMKAKNVESSNVRVLQISINREALWFVQCGDITCANSRHEVRIHWSACGVFSVTLVPTW